MAFPWTSARLAAAKESAGEVEGLSEDERETLKNSLDDLTADSPKTEVAASRVKALIAKSGKVAPILSARFLSRSQLNTRRRSSSLDRKRILCRRLALSDGRASLGVSLRREASVPVKSRSWKLAGVDGIRPARRRRDKRVRSCYGTHQESVHQPLT